MADPPDSQVTEPAAAKKASKKKPVCRFYNTKAGCRAGDKCRFLHPAQETTATQEASKAMEEPEAPTPSSSSSAQAPQATPQPAPSRVVARPTPKAQAEDPRSFQVSQIQRRFKATSSEIDKASTLTFGLRPTDPDFPYDIDLLECELTVPQSYPASGRPALRVRNKDIPRGFQINIERGFDSLVSESPNATLLALVNRLDQRLEAILGGKVAETVTLVSNRTAKPTTTESKPTPEAVSAPPKPIHAVPAAPTVPQLEDARRKRASSVRQLEARFSKVPAFSKTADGLTYTLPLDSPKRSAWPFALQFVKTMRIIVPERYPLEPLSLLLDNQSAEARAVERAFRERSQQQTDASVTPQVNYLTLHIKDMAAAASVKPVSEPVQPARAVLEETKAAAETQASQQTLESSEKPHVHRIPRPPEWDLQNDSDDDDFDSEESSDYDIGTEDGTADEAKPGEEQAPAAAPAERGILLSFPKLDLHGIELLELTSLNLTVKCERCKDTTDVEKLRSVTESDKMREVTCKKCATVLAVRFRADLIHANSVRAGYLDLDGCTVVDMLPSNFIPTCSECSTAYPAPGVAAVRGDAAFAVCRECHRKMTFRIIEVKFLLVSASAIRASRAPGKKKARENLGITVGTELPRQGRCSHYRKSYRWFRYALHLAQTFSPARDATHGLTESTPKPCAAELTRFSRFSCCQKVYPCDRCHDEQSDHPNEHANRMLCGFCSREQNYRPEDCSTCHAALTGKKGRGFWEGGKGTRDPMRMSRKDPRKYKRPPGTKSKK
ncbi:uncharacterized protein LTR77_007709 [Saxophila tyrrhenica]|uniref:CHY-type domain-containing protein n=1 Tax=Saxophila tyrrhenica TaxID=1690608 RepID=A0AAV9P3D1_9PEZI|nr:hypothetical protein LTR77_007709 [Saxophila tyrrhenica]